MGFVCVESNKVYEVPERVAGSGMSRVRSVYH